MASVASATATSIAATVPSNIASGPITVATSTGTAVSATDFFVAPNGYVAADIQFTGRTTAGTPIAVSIATANKIGLVTFVGTAGQLSTVQLTSNTMGSVAVTLYGPDGTALTATTSAAASFNLLPQWLAVTGTYTIGFDPTATNTGGITATVATGPTATLPPARPSGAILDPSHGLAANLSGLFLMNETSGTSDLNLVDGQGATLTGTNPPVWITGEPSVLLRGGATLSSYLDAGAAITFDRLPTSKMTIVAKVFVNSLSAAGICEKNDGNAANGFVFGWTSSGALSLTVEKTTDMFAATGPGVVASGQWLQVAFTWDGTVGTAAAAHLYLYGIEQTKVTSSDGSGTVGYANATNQPFRIGNASFNFPGALNGRFAYLAVYKNRILTSSEMNQLDVALPITTADSSQTVTPNGAAATYTTATAAQKAQLTFSGTNGQVATVQLSSNTLQPVTVSLLTPSRATVISVTSSTAAFTLGPAWLPTTGVYTIYIQPGAGVSGTITASVTVSTLTPRSSGAVIDPSNLLSTNLAGLFLMNEGSGTSDKNLADLQVASVAGTSSPTWNTGDPSMVFNGGGSLASYLDAGTTLTFDQLPTSKMSIVAMVYMNAATASGISEKNDGNTKDGFAFGWASTGALTFTVEKSTLNLRVATAASAATLGQWMQVALTWDGTVGTAAAAHLFINGVEQTKATSTDGSGALDYTNATNQPFRIGNARFDFTGALNGKIQYLALYKGRILTSAELNQLALQLPITASDVTAAVSSGTPVSVTTASAGQKAQVTFTATTSQHASIQLTNNTIGAITVSLLRQDRTIVTSLTSSAATITLPSQWLLTSGLHTVYIQPAGATNGSVTIALTLASYPSRPTSASLDTGNALSTSLVGLFLMNEGTGSTDRNIVNAQTASLSGTTLPTWNTTDPSVVFNGGGSLNSYLNAGTDLSFDQLPTSKVTLVAKVYVTTAAAAGVAEKNDGNVADGFLFGWTSTGALKLLVEKSSANMYAVTAANAVPTGRWVQVAFTWDGTVGTAATAHLFIDGIEQTKATSTSGSGTLGYAAATNKPFRIGNAAFDFAGSLNGKMAYLAVYKGRILTASEMGDLDAQLPIQ
jgi:hypothetical protein